MSNLMEGARLLAVVEEFTDTNVWFQFQSQLVVPPAHEANLMAPSEEGMGSGVVRGQLERVLQKSRSDLSVRRHQRR
jgi:hypothetical protein